MEQTRDSEKAAMSEVQWDGETVGEWEGMPNRYPHMRGRLRSRWNVLKKKKLKEKLCKPKKAMNMNYSRCVPYRLRRYDLEASIEAFRS